VDIYTNQYGKEGWWRPDCNKENYKKECMRKLSIVILTFIFTLMAVPTHAQSAKNAVRVLEKLETQCESGVSYQDYKIALMNTKLPVNFYLEGSGSSNNLALADSIKKVMAHYEFVGIAWQDANSNEGNPTPFSAGMELEIIGRYPITDKSIPEGGARQNNRTLMKEPVFVIIWGAASSELRKAKLLLDKDASERGLKQGFGMEF
jgi:hypothetical protein